MPKFRNIRVKMANGRSRIQRARVLASGKLRFVKNTARKSRSGAKRASRKARKIGSSVRRRRSPSKPKRNNRKRSNNTPMVKGLKNLPLISSPLVKKIFIAAGASAILTTVAAIIFPRAVPALQSTVGRAVVGFITGDFVGAAANVALPIIATGGLGNGNSGNSAVTGSAGFA